MTTNLLLNGEVLTQSPAVKGFQVYAVPFEEGSWKSKALLSVGGLIVAAGVAPSDSAFGWLAKSAVSYVVEESLGFSPDFDETLGKQIKEFRRKSDRVKIDYDLSQGRFDSLIEKVEPGLKSIHRPLVKSQSAKTAQIDFRVADRSGTMDGYFSPETFEYINRTITTEDFSEYCGNISSYNTNTFKGRIYVPSQKRTIPFELSDSIRSIRTINVITGSLRANGRLRASGGIANEADVCFEALRNESVSGRLKSLFVTEVSAEQ